MKNLSLKTIKNKVRCFKRLLVKKVIVCHLIFLKHIHGMSPISLKYWIAIRNVLYVSLRETDLLFPPYESLSTTSKLFMIPELKHLLANDTLGEWALDSETIALLGGFLLREVISPQSKVDWILIDGPAGSPGCRFNTLPTLLRFCHVGTRWFIADAFRDAEMKVLHQWQNIQNIAVEGIYPIGKGLATGQVL